MPDSADNWQLNYFNYFTEVEERFQQARGTSLFLLSPLDWALIESWKNSGVPLEAVLRGIDIAFENARARRSKVERVNSLAYCAQAVLKEAQRIADNLPASPAPSEPALPADSIRNHLASAASTLDAAPGFESIARSVHELIAHLDDLLRDLQDLDLRLTALEDKMSAIARTRLTDDDLFAMRRELEAQLRPYRSRMTADQISRLEKSFLDRMVYEKLALPRLSLFFVR
jgi:hypothetical protein